MTNRPLAPVPPAQAAIKSGVNGGRCLAHAPEPPIAPPPAGSEFHPELFEPGPFIPTIGKGRGGLKIMTPALAPSSWRG